MYYCFKNKERSYLNMGYKRLKTYMVAGVIFIIIIAMFTIIGIKKKPNILSNIDGKVKVYIYDKYQVNIFIDSIFKPTGTEFENYKDWVIMVSDNNEYYAYTEYNNSVIFNIIQNDYNNSELKNIVDNFEISNYNLETAKNYLDIGFPIKYENNNLILEVTGVGNYFVEVSIVRELEYSKIQKDIELSDKEFIIIDDNLNLKYFIILNDIAVIYTYKPDRGNIAQVNNAIEGLNNIILKIYNKRVEKEDKTKQIYDGSSVINNNDNLNIKTVLPNGVEIDESNLVPIEDYNK